MDIIYPEDNKSEKSKETTLFHSNIRRLYKLIDKSSCLLWNHNNHITIGKKRQFDSEENFFNIETTQLGYGEISIASMTQLFNFLMNIDTYLSQEDESLVESYNLTKDSYFLDIGSGFGKPVFHCAYQVGCICQGIEVVPARVEFCVDFYFGFSDGRNDLSTEIAFKDNKNKKVYKKKKNGKKKKENQGGIKIIKTYENLRLKKYIDFKELFTNIKFNYDWFNLYALGYNFCMNPDIDDLIWSIQQPKIKYQNYNDNKINPEIYFYLKNKNQDTWVISYLTQLLYEIKQRNILTLTSNEIDYLYDEPFPSIKTKILENANYMDINKSISNNIVNNLYKSSTNNYIPLIDFNDELSQQTSENTHLLDFLSFVNDITTIDMHDYNNYERLNNITNDNNNNKDKDKDISNDMIIEEELIKKDEEKENNNNNDMIINFQNEQNSPKNTDILKYLQNLLTFNPHDSEFYKKCSFLCNDATKYSDYHYDPPFDAKKEMKHPFTHIYSYNKLMGDTCKEKICEILNNSDWKVLAWYTNEKQTRESGLENFKFIASFPMTSTGNQKFSCYVYIKLYD
jgi:SAM-dependent methyltransferase